MIFMSNPNGIQGTFHALPALPRSSNDGLQRNGKRHATASHRLETLREDAADCRACPLWKDATQTVFGEGPQHAP